ncbi:MAG: dTMP kinase [Bacteroidota bacterium]
MRKNLFIALEGIDGSGKSTQTKKLAEKLKAAGHQVYSTYEPTDSPIGSLIRNIFKGRLKVDDKSLAALFSADRLDHLLNEVNGIVQKMKDGHTVIMDRYYFSSYAYHGTHMSMDWVIASNAMSAEILRPDLNIFIDVPPEVCIQRLQSNRQQIELYETLDNLIAVRNKYFEAFDLLADQEKIAIIDGNQPIDAITAAIWETIQQAFPAVASS